MRRIFYIVDVHPPPVPPPVPGLTGLAVVARGGYATVYRAVQESIGREVAVKIENRSLDTEPDRRRFMREARASGRMSSHPHVVDLFDAGVLPDGHPYLIMELCDGSYADRLRTGPLAPAEVRDVGVKIADALSDAHGLGVLHRDVKPANILVSGFGEPTLADFGLAVLAEMRDVSTSMDVMTPAYAPREAFRHACEPSPAADVYSLCATLYALLRGKPPRWRDDREPSLLTLLQMFEEPIPNLPGVPDELLDVLRTGLANDPATRPTAGRLRDALAAVPLQPAPVPADDAVRVTPPVESRPEAWTMPTQPTHAQRPDGDATVHLADQAPAGPVGASLPPARSRWPFLGAGVAILLLSVLASAVAYRANQMPNHRVLLRIVGASRISSTARSGGWTPDGRCALGVLGAACPGTAQCFDALTVGGGVVQARPLPCPRPHTWEVFATGTLPGGLADVGYPRVKAEPAVARVCNAGVLMLVDMVADTWQVDVLPPSPEAYARGDRAFRCLAGTGANQQTVPSFGR